MKNLFIQEIMCGLQSENVTGKKNQSTHVGLGMGGKRKIVFMSEVMNYL